MDFDCILFAFNLLNISPENFNLFLESNYVAEKTKVVFCKIHTSGIHKAFFAGEIVVNLLCRFEVKKFSDVCLSHLKYYL